MQNFGGSARSRPRVNLGGKRKELTKEEVLQKAAHERTVREENRKRDNGARTIQQQWAAHKARGRALDVWRDKFDFLYPSFESEATLLTSYYLFFFTPRRDRKRSVRLAKDVVSHNMVSKLVRVSELRDSFLAITKLKDLTTQEAIAMLGFFEALARDRPEQVNDKLYKYLAQEALSRRNYDTVIRAILLPLKSDIPSVYLAFVRQVLTIEHDPAFLIHCKNLNVSRIVTSVLKNSADPEEFSIARCVILLKNVIAITSDGVQTSGPSTKARWMEAVANLLQQLYLQPLPPIAIGSLDNSEEIVPIGRVEIGALDPELKILTGPILRSLLEPTFSISFALYASTLFQCNPAGKEELLMNLSLYATSPLAQYNLLQSSYHAWLGGQPTEVSEELIFYVELLSRVLFTMADNEFFDPHRNPLSIDIIRDTAARLKDFIYKFYMKYTDQSAILLQERLPISAGYCQDTIARLLQQIHVRDTRRQFLPKDFWLYTEKFDMKSFVQQVATEAFVVPDDSDDDDEEEVRKPTRFERFVSPRSRILSNCPFMLPFHIRIEVLRALIGMDTPDMDPFSRHRGPHVQVRRGHEFEDGFDALWQVGTGIKEHISVDYQDVHGIQEAGIDGGGLTKEFLTSVCKQAFHPDFGLFVETPERLLYPSPSAYAKGQSQLQHFEFLGRIIAKCIYSGVLIDVAFAPFFLMNWVGKLSYLDDLQAMDKDLYNGLIQLKNYNGDVENDLGLDFTLNDEDAGQQKTINLLPNGQDIPVTKSNRLKYIHLVCNYKLNSRLAKQSQAFVKGLGDVLDPKWLSMFNQTEMQALVGGAPVPIDIADLRRNTAYGGFDEADTTVQIFWDVLHEFSSEELRNLLKFVTSTPRPPLLGFKELRPSFSLRNAGSDLARLPTASTCVNLLKLPAYTTHELMRRKLRLSITAEAGFDLS